MKHLRLKRYSYFWLYSAFSIGIPIALIAAKYQLFKTAGYMQLTGWGLISLLILFLFFKKQFKEMIKTLEQSTFKSILQNFGVPIGIGTALGICLLVQYFINNFIFILAWSTVSNVIAVYFKVKHMQYVPAPVEDDKPSETMYERFKRNVKPKKVVDAK